jgi:hypothetical protein
METMLVTLILDQLQPFGLILSVYCPSKYVLGYRFMSILHMGGSPISRAIQT